MMGYLMGYLVDYLICLDDGLMGYLVFFIPRGELASFLSLPTLSLYITLLDSNAAIFFS